MRYFIVLLSIFLPFESGLAARDWYKLTTPNFELYTSGGEGAGRRTILHFERVRSFFLQVMKTEQAESGRVVIVAFRSPKEFRPFQRHRQSEAFFLKGRDRDHIVIGGTGPEQEETAIHEFVHLLVARSGIEIPLWLNEGLAELYSNLAPQGKNVLVGNMIPGRVVSLQRRGWLPLETLTTVDHDSSIYNDGEEAGIFYAQSWFLTHMLNLSEDYRPKFSECLRALLGGASAADAFATAYGKSLSEVERDLKAYERGQLRVAVFPIKLEKSAEEPAVEVADPLDVELLQGKILARIGKTEEADRRFAVYVAQRPDDPLGEEALGYRHWIAGDDDAARRHFGRAVELGSGSARLYFDYAMLRREAGAAEKELIPLLAKAVELRPEYKEARIGLGQCWLRERNYDEAVRQFSQIKSIASDRAVVWFHDLAVAYQGSGDREKAMAAANRAKQYAKTPEEISLVDGLLQYFNQVQQYETAARGHVPPDPVPVAQPPAEEWQAATPAPAPETEGRPKLTRDPAGTGDGSAELSPREARMIRIEGSLQSVDCFGQRARLNVFAGGKKYSFAIYDPKSVIVTGTDGVAAELKCDQRELIPVVLEFEPKDDPELGTLGVVRIIEFE